LPKIKTKPSFSYLPFLKIIYIYSLFIFTFRPLHILSAFKIGYRTTGKLKEGLLRHLKKLERFLRCFIVSKRSYESFYVQVNQLSLVFIQQNR